VEPVPQDFIVKKTNRMISGFEYKGLLTLDEMNDLITDYRKSTKDAFLPLFKGLRADGFYRRRMTFKIFKTLIS